MTNENKSVLELFGLLCLCCILGYILFTDNNRNKIVIAYKFIVFAVTLIGGVACLLSKHFQDDKRTTPSSSIKNCQRETVVSSEKSEILIHCTHCNTRFPVPNGFAGDTLTCEKCGREIPLLKIEQSNRTVEQEKRSVQPIPPPSTTVSKAIGIDRKDDSPDKFQDKVNSKKSLIPAPPKNIKLEKIPPPPSSISNQKPDSG